jgi:hypothetical protein
LSVGAILVVLVFAIGFARAFNYSFRANDDTVFWYLTGVELAKPQAVAQSNDAVRAYLAEQKDAVVALPRWQLRELYSQNYLVASAVIYASSRAIEKFVQAFRCQYGLFFTSSLALGFIICAAIAASVLRWTVVTSRDLATVYGTLLGVSVIALSSVVPQSVFNLPAGGNLAMIPGIPESLGYLGIQVVAAHPEYSIFGYTPRNQFYLCAVAVFLLRWRESWFAAYALTVALMLFHQSMAGLMLVLLVAVDVLLRPQVFDRKVTAVVLLGTVVMLGRETLFSMLGLWPAVAVAAALLLIGGALVLARPYFPQMKLFASVDKLALAPLRGRLERFGIIGADLITIFAVWLITLPVALVAVRIASPAAAYHFWGEIHVRMLMLWQPLLFVGVCVLLVRWLEARLVIDRRWLYGVVIAVSALAVTPALVQAITYYDAGLNRFAGTVLSYSQLVGKPLPQLETQVREAVLYFAISAEVDSQANLVRPMLAGRN